MFFTYVFLKNNFFFFNIIDNQKIINDVINKKKSFILSIFNLAPGLSLIKKIILISSRLLLIKNINND
jgi:hypothetical protein